MTPCVPDAGSLPMKPKEHGAMPAVRIIMSTFNGARFLPELLTSVSQQTGVTVRWWIRDDGSTDSTREILTEASNHMDMHVSAGLNKGVVSSFLELLNDWNVTGPEIQALADLSLTLVRIDEQSEDATVSVIVMDRNPSAPTDLTTTSYRSLQGSRQGSGSRDRIGNPLGQLQRQVVDDEHITAQLHVFRVGDTANLVPNTLILASLAPSLVVHLPESFRHRVLTFDPRD